MIVLVTVLLFLAFLGHAMLSVRVLNRLHALPLPRRFLKLISLGVYAFGAGMPVLLAAWAVYYQWQPQSLPTSFELPYGRLVGAYLFVALVAMCVLVPQWLHWRVTSRPPVHLLSNHGTRAHLGADLGPAAVAGWGRLYHRLPGNEILHLEENEKTLALPRLPPSLDGLSIAHISDLHISGWIGRSYFDEVVRRVNAMNADVVMIAGDVVDFNRSLDSACDVVSQLRATHGVYYVLGNHDRRVDHPRLRQSLDAAGLVDLSARWRTIEIRGQSVLLAGNELPWFPPGPRLDDCPMLDSRGERMLRILLAHTPDQIRFAQRHDFDLLLAGHTHGGQIRLPLLGPIVAPSRYGVRYASGTFFESPTLMHVSRGVSGLQLVRWNCPPEITKLVLRKG